MPKLSPSLRRVKIQKMPWELTTTQARYFLKQNGFESSHVDKQKKRDLLFIVHNFVTSTGDGDRPVLVPATEKDVRKYSMVCFLFAVFEARGYFPPVRVVMRLVA